MTTQRQTNTTHEMRDGYALEDLDISPGVLGALAEMEAARQDSRSLSGEDRAAYVAAICAALKLNPLTRPVRFLALQGGETLYLTRGATDQLAARHGLNRATLEGPDFRTLENVKVAYCKVRVTLPSGRFEEATATLKITSPADDLMRVETKAKRRGTLSILGVGVLSEEEAESIPASEHAKPAPPKTPSPLQLPRDNGPSPSGAPLPAAEPPVVEAPPVALPLSDRDLRAMLGELTSATDLAALRAAWKGMADDEKRGTEEQRAALLDAATKRKAVFAEGARLRDERKAAADAEPPNDDGPPKPPRGPRKPRTHVAPADATGGGAEGADGPVDASGARSSSGHPMTTRAERRAHLATLPLAETVRLSWRHRAAMPPPGYREDCADRVCALTHGFGVEDALAYLDAAPLRVVASQPKTRAA